MRKYRNMKNLLNCFLNRIRQPETLTQMIDLAFTIPSEFEDRD